MFISYKELSALSSALNDRERIGTRTTHRTAFLPMNRSAKSSTLNDKGDATVGTIAATKQAGRIVDDRDWFSRSLSIILLHRIVFISRSEDIIPEFPTTHDTATIRRSHHKPQQPHRDRRRSQQAQSASSSIVRNKGWYPNQMERNNNTNIGKTTKTSVGDKRSRRGILFIWDYTGKQQQTPTSNDKGWYYCRTITTASTLYLKGGPRGMVWWIFRERVC